MVFHVYVVYFASDIYVVITIIRRILMLVGY